MISDETSKILQQHIKKANQENNRKKKIFHLLLFVIVVEIVFSLFGVARVNSNSMETNYEIGDIVIYLKLGNEYQKDDIIIMDYNGYKIMRRVVATYSDKVDIDNDLGVLIINNKEEKNQNGKTVSDPEGIKYPIYVAEEEYFVLCDNRSYTIDSRRFGCVQKQNIIGKIILSF